MTVKFLFYSLFLFSSCALAFAAENEMPSRLPWEAYRNVPPPFCMPHQGLGVPIIKRELPIELQDRGDIMNHPQPQKNPSIE